MATIYDNQTLVLVPDTTPGSRPGWQRLVPEGGTWDSDLIGTDEDDTLHAGKGADRVYGGAGIDTLVVGTLFQQTALDGRADGSLRVGDDTVREVEYIQFADVRMPVADALHAATLPRTGTGADDTLIGSDFGYTLDGGGGDDTLLGMGGDDTLYGGKGQDAAVYRGARAEYRVLYDHTQGGFIVEDTLAGRDGRDLVYSMEKLRFADAALDLPAPPASVFDALSPQALALLDGVIGAPLPLPGLIDPGVGGGDAILDGVVEVFLVEPLPTPWVWTVSETPMLVGTAEVAPAWIPLIAGL